MKLPPKSIVYKNQIALRLFSPKDALAIFQAVNESLPSLKKYMNWAHYPCDFEKACGIYADFESKSLAGSDVSFTGFDLMTGEFLFCTSLSSGSRLNPKALDLGYWVSSKHECKGVGTIAAKITTVLAFQYYNTDRLSVGCNPDNQGSLNVIKKCGFQFEGKLRNNNVKPTHEMIKNGYSPVTDTVYFSLTDDDLASLEWYSEFAKQIAVVPYYL